MPASEIDDIFSGKVSKLAVSKGKEKAPTIVSSAPPSKKSKKRKQRDVDAVADEPVASSSESLKTKKTKKKSATHADADGGEEKVKAKAKAIRVVETVRDPSAGVASLASSTTSRGKFKKSGAADAKNLPSLAKAKLRKSGDSEEEYFKDSRGSGPRKRTEDGFLVYKEDELGIKDEGGDTPLCPFDCNCCF